MFPSLLRVERIARLRRKKERQRSCYPAPDYLNGKLRYLLAQLYAVATYNMRFSTDPFSSFSREILRIPRALMGIYPRIKILFRPVFGRGSELRRREGTFLFSNDISYDISANINRYPNLNYLNQFFSLSEFSSFDSTENIFQRYLGPFNAQKCREKCKHTFPITYSN